MIVNNNRFAHVWICIIQYCFRMKKLFFLIFLIALVFEAKSGVDTISIPSNAMGQTFNAVVVTPKGYKKRKAYPTVYLLHGFAGNYSNWIVKAPFLQALSTQYKMIIVCPNGGFSSWYFDSPIDTTMKYKTYIGKEVIDFIDSHYATIKQKTARAITGLSMGGHGALYLAKEFSETFGACGSMSGGVNLYASKNKFDISKRIGDTLRFKQSWIDYSAVSFLPKVNKQDSLKIIIDCGIDDFFFEANQQLHHELIKNKVPHDFIVRPGAHNWVYWTNAVKYQLQFFYEYFMSKRIEQ